MKVVLINGPKRSGKNTLATMIAKQTSNVEIIGFSHHLKRFVHAIYLGAKGWKMDPDVFDAVKEVPQEILSGFTWRQMYIHYSEKVIKPMHGAEWFGRQFMRAAYATGAYAILVPDSGFREEAENVVRAVGPENVLLIRLHRDGCVYDATDSRGYIRLDDIGVWQVDMHNYTDDLDRMRERVPFIVNWILS